MNTFQQQLAQLRHERGRPELTNAEQARLLEGDAMRKAGFNPANFSDRMAWMSGERKTPVAAAAGAATSAATATGERPSPAQKQADEFRTWLRRGGRPATPDALDNAELKKELHGLLPKLAAADPRMQFSMWLRKGVAVVDEDGTPAWASKQAQALRDLQQRERSGQRMRESKAVPLADFASAAAGEDSGLVRLTGYASTYDLDLGGDRIAKGAFADTLQALEERRARTGAPFLVPILAGHDLAKPIGGVVSAKELPGGLYIEALLDVDTPEGFAVVSGASKHHNRGMSIGYFTKKSHYEGGGVRVLDVVDLFEISITPIPMNVEATIDSLS
jgi:HK97 family phage prohead protease